METFKDLIFAPHRNEDNCTQARVTFPNGYGISVLFGDAFYSNGVDNYEVALVDKNGYLDGYIFEKIGMKYPGDDVIGYVSEDFITDVMERVQQLD